MSIIGVLLSLHSQHTLIALNKYLAILLKHFQVYLALKIARATLLDRRHFTANKYRFYEITIRRNMLSVIILNPYLHHIYNNYNTRNSKITSTQETYLVVKAVKSFTHINNNDKINGKRSAIRTV